MDNGMPELHNDDMTKAIQKALFAYMIKEGLIHPFKALAEICCLGERTMENRLSQGGWGADEIKLMARTFDSEDFKKEAINYIFNNK